MLRAISLTALLSISVATQFPTYAATAATSANPAPKVTVEIPFSYVGGRLIAVRGSIGARENLTFLVDIGTTYTLIDRKIASQMESGESLAVSHFSSSLSANEVVLSSLVLGSLHFDDFHAYLTDLSEMPVAPTGVAGILGADFLSRGNVTFDFASQKIVFSERVSGSHQVRLEKCAVGYAVQTSWKKQPVKLALSNGVEVITLDRDRVNEKFVKLGGLKPGAIETNFSVTPVSLFKTKDMAIGDMRLHSEGVVRKIGWPVASDHLDGFLPLTALRASRVSLDFERGLLLWDSAEDKMERAQNDQHPAAANSLREN